MLSEWLRIHRVTVGDIWGDTFVRLIARRRWLLLYRKDVWGGEDNLDRYRKCRCELLKEEARGRL